MARLKNPKLSTLTPQQRDFLDGLKTAPAIGPDEYFLNFKGGKQPKRKPSRPSHGNTFEPDESIKTLAMLAAEWLADQWPKDVREQGRGPFVVARYDEILKRDWNPKYWEEMPLQEETTRVGFPSCMLPTTPTVIKFYEPDKQNTWCTYDKTELATGDAGYHGMLDPDGYYRDKHHLEKHFLFTLPKPDIDVGVRPLFSSHEASWQVTQQHKNVQPWCSLYKASTAKTKGDIVGLADSVDKVGRYYYHKYHHPSPAVGGSIEYMSRRYTVDALYLSHDYGYMPNEPGVCLIQSAPAAIRGLYRYHSWDVTIQMPQSVKLYRAKVDDTHDPACCYWPPTLQSWAVSTNACNVTQTFEGEGTPCWAIWYYNKLALTTSAGVTKPLTHPFHYFKTVPLRGIPGNQAYGKQIIADIIPVSRNQLLPSPYPEDPLIQVLCNGPTGTWRHLNGSEWCENTGNGPCVGAYAGWGYRAWDSCAKKWKVHVFPGQSPGWTAFSAAWKAGKYPL